MTPTWPFRRLSVDLSKHQVHGTDDSNGVRQELVTHHEVCAGQMGKSRSADLALIRPVAAVRDEVDTHLALGGFYCAVCLAGRDRVAFREDLCVSQIVKRALGRPMWASTARGVRGTRVVDDIP